MIEVNVQTFIVIIHFQPIVTKTLIITYFTCYNINKLFFIQISYLKTSNNDFVNFRFQITTTILKVIKNPLIYTQITNIVKDYLI